MPLDSPGPAREAQAAMPPGAEPCRPSATATDTTERLKKLRALMAANNVAAYIVPSDDEHGVVIRGYSGLLRAQGARSRLRAG